MAYRTIVAGQPGKVFCRLTRARQLNLAAAEVCARVQPQIPGFGQSPDLGYLHAPGPG
jgi:hypothetical protein